MPKNKRPAPRKSAADPAIKDEQNALVLSQLALALSEREDYHEQDDILRQQDLDGNSSYSPVVSVHGVQSSPARIFSQGGTIVIQVPPTVVVQVFDVDVYDTEGKLLRRDHVTTGGVCRIGGLPPHRLYLIRMGDDRYTLNYSKAVLLDQ